MEEADFTVRNDRESLFWPACIAAAHMALAAALAIAAALAD